MHRIDPVKNIYLQLEELIALRTQERSLSIEAKIISRLKEMNTTYHQLDRQVRADVDKLLEESDLHELLAILKEKKSGSSFAKKLGTIKINEPVLFAKLKKLRGSVVADESVETSNDVMIDTGTVKKWDEATMRNDQIGLALDRASKHKDNTGYITNALLSPREDGDSGDSLSIIIETIEALRKAKINKERELREGGVSKEFERDYREKIPRLLDLLFLHRQGFHGIAQAQPICAAKLAKIKNELEKSVVDEAGKILKAETIIAVIDESLIEQLKSLQSKRDLKALKKF